MSLLSPGLQAFLAVAERRSVHRAAKQLGLSQTGVTQRLRAMERELSVTLFTRSRRGMLPTPEGEALLQYCRSARDLEGPILAKIGGGGVQESVSICISGPSSLMRSRIIPACLPVMQKYPELLLRFKISDTNIFLDDLKSGEAQIAVLAPELLPRELDSKLLKPDRFVMLGTRSWLNRPLQEVVAQERIIDFDPEDQITFNYLRRFRLLEHVRPGRHFVNNNEALASMIEAGLGYGVLTDDFAKRFLQRCDLVLLNQGKFYERRLAIAWYARPAAPAYWRALISAIN